MNAVNFTRNALYTGIAVAGMTILSSCDAVIDCIDNDGPEFRDTSLLPATLNQVYLDTIRAAVNNDPFDDGFEYDFDIISGRLPAGISTDQTGRTFTVSGTPTELGDFTFELNVFIDDGLNITDSGLCFRNKSREFTLTVNQDAS